MTLLDKHLYQHKYMDLDKLHKQLSSKDPKLLLKILLIILGIALIILYVLPDTLALLFTTALGNAILLLGAIYLFFYKDYRITLLYLLCWIIITRFIQRAANTTEGFVNTSQPSQPPQPWTSQQIRAFTALQNTINPNINFDTAQIQKYATPQELDYFMEHLMWPWSADTEEQYKIACAQNPYISDTPGNSLNHAKRIYSQGQIQQIMFMQSKNGRALIDGIIINDTQRHKEKEKDIYAIRAGLDTYGDPLICCSNDSPGKPQRIEPHGALINTNGSVGVLVHAEAIYPRIRTEPTPAELTLANNFIGSDYSTACSNLFSP